MGRKKQKVNHARKDDFWCYFCDREFNSEASLLDHQMMRHFSCTMCRRRGSNVMGLSTHVAQVHKTVLGCVPEALPGRDDPKICANVFGMNNIPPDALKERRVKLGIVDEEPARYLPSPASSKNAATALWTRCFNHSDVLAHASTSRSFKYRSIGISEPVLTLWAPLLTLARFCSCVSTPGGVAAPVCLYKSSLSAKNTSSYHSW